MHRSFSTFAVVLTLVSVVFIVRSYRDFTNVSNANDLTLQLLIQTGELSNLTSDYLLYKESRAVTQWQSKYDQMQESLIALQRTPFTTGVPAVSIQLERLSRIFGLFKASNGDRDLSANLFLHILELQTEIRQYDQNVKNSRDEALVQLLFAGCSAVVSLLLFGLTNIYTRKLLEQATERLSESNTQLKILAHTDQLTGLTNREGLYESLGLDEKRSSPIEPMEILMLDVDYFRSINETFSRRAGDQYLVKLAEELRSATDTHTQIARLEGGLFIVVRPATETVALMEYAEHLRWVAEQAKIEYQGELISRSVSMGVARFESADEFSTQLHYADLALAEAKQLGRNQVVQSDSALKDKEARRSRMFTSTEIANGLEAGEFCYFLQPIFDTHSKEPAGFEALVRWRKPSGEILPPGDFLPYFVREFFKPEHKRTRVAMHNAVVDALVGFEGAYISWNFNLEQFGSEFVVSALIDGTEPPFVNEKYPPVLEVSENAISSRSDHGLLFKNLQRLRSAGYLIALDDFGVQQSNLFRLINLPIDIVKIDKSLVDNSETDTKVRATFRFISQMAKSLGLKVVAEGMETSLQSRMLSEAEVHLQQGYYHAKPMLPADVAAYFKNTG